MDSRHISLVDELLCVLLERFFNSLDTGNKLGCGNKLFLFLLLHMVKLVGFLSNCWDQLCSGTEMVYLKNNLTTFKNKKTRIICIIAEVEQHERHVILSFYLST